MKYTYSIYSKIVAKIDCGLEVSKVREGFVYMDAPQAKCLKK